MRERHGCLARPRPGEPDPARPDAPGGVALRGAVDSSLPWPATPSLRLLTELVETAPDAMIVVDGSGCMVLVNQQTEALFGYSRDEMLGRPIEILLPERHRSAHTGWRQGFSAQPVLRPMGSGRAFQARRRDGSEFPVEVSLAPLHVDGTTAVSAVVRDVTARVEAHAQLERLALHDPLTGLGNRLLLMDRLRGALARQVRAGGTVAVLFFDVDRLKWVNDSLGHEAGDMLLVAVSQRIVAALRPSDTVARLGGDELVAVVEGVCGPDDLERLAERVLASVGQPLELAGRELRPNASVGIAMSTGGSGDPETLLRDADAAMYRAKHAGRRRAEVYRPELRQPGIDDLGLHIELRAALESGDVESGGVDVHYQPVVDLRDGSLWGLEALVRWTSPTFGPVRADHVVALAERSRLILELDRAVLRKACAAAAALPLPPGARVGVNVSPRHLDVGDLAVLVQEALDESGLPATSLWLEITETEELSHENATAALDAVRRLGVRVAVDDFGTGFSSLQRLRDLPLDLIKIDRGFLADVDRDPRNEALVSAAATLGRALGLDVLAEGVETERQVQLLERLGCDLGQGYHWARPMPMDQLRGWLATRPCTPAAASTVAAGVGTDVPALV